MFQDLLMLAALFILRIGVPLLLVGGTVVVLRAVGRR